MGLGSDRFDLRAGSTTYLQGDLGQVDLFHLRFVFFFFFHLKRQAGKNQYCRVFVRMK